MRHVPRTHRIDLDWLFERLRNDTGVSSKYVSSKFQIGDILTKGSFSAEMWRNLCGLANLVTPYPVLKTRDKQAVMPLAQGKVRLSGGVSHQATVSSACSFVAAKVSSRPQFQRHDLAISQILAGSLQDIDCCNRMALSEKQAYL